MESADTDSSLRGNEETVPPLMHENFTGMQKGVTSYELLSASLSCLATRRDYEEIKFCVALSPQALLKSIPNTCKAFQK
jgi:hypothetical protein